MNNDLLQNAADRAKRYTQQADTMPVYPRQAEIDNLAQFDEPFPEQPSDPQDVIAMLDDVGAPATVVSTGRRYFGFVTGGALPVAVAANWLATTWDQNPAGFIGSPTVAKLESVAESWLLDALDFPRESAVGFVTGATMANFCALAAARHALLQRAGWNVETQGLFGAPEIKVVVGDEVHASLLQALQMVGFGRERVIRVPVDDQGRMKADALANIELDELTLVCIQAGNVNSGAFDPARAICEKAKAAGAWVHVDGAFGMWVRAVPSRKHLTDGVDLADSWALDGHKWLNVPYDSGIVICRHPQALSSALSIRAPYFLIDEELHKARRQPMDFTPEMSRRARGIEVWAALKSLGREGLADLVDGCCQLATKFADGLRDMGYNILNEVVINQVYVSFGSDEDTRRMIAAIEQDGTFWAGHSTWQGKYGMRISVSSWATTADDIDKCLDAVKRCAQQVL